MALVPLQRLRSDLSTKLPATQTGSEVGKFHRLPHQDGLRCNLLRTELDVLRVRNTSPVYGWWGDVVVRDAGIVAERWALSIGLLG